MIKQSNVFGKNVVAGEITEKTESVFSKILSLVVKIFGVIKTKWLKG